MSWKYAVKLDNESNAYENDAMILGTDEQRIARDFWININVSRKNK